MEARVKHILNIVVIIAVVLWLLSAFGVLSGLPRIHISRPLDTWFGLLVHTGRIHSHSFSRRGGGRRASRHSRSKATVAALES